jgi:hypothetical protein
MLPGLWVNRLLRGRLDERPPLPATPVGRPLEPRTIRSDVLGDDQGERPDQIFPLTWMDPRLVQRVVKVPARLELAGSHGYPRENRD